MPESPSGETFRHANERRDNIGVTSLKVKYLFFVKRKGNLPFLIFISGVCVPPAPSARAVLDNHFPPPYIHSENPDTIPHAEGIKQCGGHFGLVLKKIELLPAKGI